MLALDHDRGCSDPTEGSHHLLRTRRLPFFWPCQPGASGVSAENLPGPPAATAAAAHGEAGQVTVGAPASMQRKPRQPPVQPAPATIPDPAANVDAVLAAPPPATSAPRTTGLERLALSPRRQAGSSAARPCTRGTAPSGRREAAGPRRGTPRCAAPRLARRAGTSGGIPAGGCRWGRSSRELRAECPAAALVTAIRRTAADDSLAPYASPGGVIRRRSRALALDVAAQRAGCSSTEGVGAELARLAVAVSAIRRHEGQPGNLRRGVGQGSPPNSGSETRRSPSRRARW